jgi:hypothetical protein
MSYEEPTDDGEACEGCGGTLYCFPRCELRAEIERSEREREAEAEAEFWSPSGLGTILLGE